MKFVYGTDTFEPTDSQYPNFPVKLFTITDSSMERTYYGSARKHTNWKRDGFGLTWTDVGSVVRDILVTWVDRDSTITFYSKHGTTDCVADPASYSCEETTLDNYNLAINLLGE